MVAPLPNARHLEVRIAGFSDTTLKRGSRVATGVDALTLTGTALSAKHRFKFVVLHLQTGDVSI